MKPAGLPPLPLHNKKHNTLHLASGIQNKPPENKTVIGISKETQTMPMID